MSLFNKILMGVTLTFGGIANAGVFNFTCFYKVYDSKNNYVRQDGPLTVAIDTAEETAEVSYSGHTQTYHAEETNPSEYVWIQGGKGIELTFLLNIATSGSGGTMTHVRTGTKMATLIGNCTHAY